MSVTILFCTQNLVVPLRQLRKRKNHTNLQEWFLHEFARMVSKIITKISYQSKKDSVDCSLSKLSKRNNSILCVKYNIGGNGNRRIIAGGSV